LFIKLIFALAVAGVLAAQDTSASVSGEIYDTTGTSIGFGEAELRLQPSPHTLFSVRMNHDGQFRFAVLPEGEYALTVSITGFKTLRVKSIGVVSGEQKILPPLHMDVAPTDLPWLPIPEFALRVTDRKFGNLSGHVKDSLERPISRAVVKLSCDERVCGETKTDANGNFIFFNLAPRDDYAFRISHPGFRTLEGADYTAFEVLAGYDANYRTIVLPRRSSKLSRAASTVR
jgi:hypothetical protein